MIMPIAVLDLDFQHLPSEIEGLEAYDSALILIRWQGRPVGQALLPLVNGRLEVDQLQTRLMDAADQALRILHLRQLQSRSAPGTGPWIYNVAWKL
jgi:hypothetical protein